MSHNVEKMVFTGAKPWWYGNSMQGDAIGVDLGDGPITSRQAIEAAGLDWDVEVVASARRQGPIWVPVSGESFLVRNKDGATNVLGRASDTYPPFQNREAFSFLDKFVQEGSMLYHTAGSLEGGKRVWILAQTPESWTVKRKSGREDRHHAFINCVLGHDGQAGIALMLTDVRVVCANTAAFAESDANGQKTIYRIAHRGDINAKMALAGQALQATIDQSMARREVLQGLAQHAMDTDEFVDFATSIFLGLDGSQEEVEENLAKFYEEATPRSKTIMENKVAKVAECFLKGQGNEGDSAYDALQGFTEYFDHFDLDHIKDKIEKGRRAAKAVNSAWLGAGAERKALVYKRLRDRLVR